MPEALAAGFTPLETLLGEVELGMVWPAAHRLAIPDPRYVAFFGEVLDDTYLTLWMVRSPWPEIELPDVSTFVTGAGGSPS